MNDLEKYFRSNNKRLIHKWNHYFAIYERHFSRFRGRPVTILEIGVSQGGSLQMWKEYFGAHAMIYGVDVDPRCKGLEEENIQILIGSQSDRGFLRNLTKQVPLVDILIDDGGHTMRQQIVTFEELYGHVKDHGVYLCEDLHTSYWMRWGGGHRRMGTFIEFAKGLIDRLHAYHSDQRSLRVDEFTRTTGSLHFYDSILVIEKEPRKAPYDEKTGQGSFSRSRKRTFLQKVAKGSGDLVLASLNTVLRTLRLPGFIWR